MAEAILLGPLVRNVVLAGLVDGEVGKMHEEVAEVVLIWRFVFSGCEPTEPLVVEVDSQGIHTAKVNIDAKIKFQFVDQEGLMKVPLNDIMVIGIEVIQVSRQKNSSSLGSRFGLRDKRLPILFHFFLRVAELFLKVAKLSWQQPSLREKIVIFRKHLLHAAQVASQMVLSCQSIHPWKVINSLEGLHAIELVDLYSAIGPHNIPLVIRILVIWIILSPAESHLEHRAGHVPHHRVLRLGYIQHQLLSFVLALLFLCCH